MKSYKVDLAAINNKLDTLLTENAALKKLVSAKDEEIAALKVQLNGVEQHNRSWSVRVLGLPLTSAEEKSSALIRDKLFKNVLLPIFEGAAREGDLREIPTNADSVLEMAHPLRARRGQLSQLSRGSMPASSERSSSGTKRRMRLNTWTALQRIGISSLSSRILLLSPSLRCVRWQPTPG